MARNRIIKPEFWSSIPLSKVSRDARLVFVGLWNFADDYGVLLDSSRRLLGDLFPLDETVTESMLNEWLDELAKQALIARIKFDGKPYMLIPNWLEHQRVDNPSRRRWLNDDVLGLAMQEYRENRVARETLARVSLDPSSPMRKNNEKEKELAPKSPARKRNELWDALVEATGFAPSTSGEQSRFGRSVKELKAVGATPEEILIRAKRFVAKYPAAACTDRAMANRWGELGQDWKSQQAAMPIPPELSRRTPQ